MRLYFDHSSTEPIYGKRLEKQENDLSEVRYFHDPRASTLQSKMTTCFFERAYHLEEKRKHQRQRLVVIDCVTKDSLFHTVLTNIMIINTRMLLYSIIIHQTHYEKSDSL